MRKKRHGIITFSEFVGGAFTGLMIGLPGSNALSRTIQHPSSSWGDSLPILAVVVLLYPLGVAGGTYAVGRLYREKGIFWMTLAGSMVGGLAIFFVPTSLTPSLSTELIQVLFLFPSPLGATLAFNIAVKVKSLSVSRSTHI